MALGLKYSNEATREWIFDRRKAKRLFLHFPIEVSGVDREGLPFSERTRTEDISDRGCRLEMNAPVNRGDLVDIRLIAPPGPKFPREDPHKFEVMWVQEKTSGWSIGAREIHDERIWKVSFPPPITST